MIIAKIIFMVFMQYKKEINMQVTSINNTPNFQARIKIDKNKVKAGLLLSGASSSSGASTVILSAGSGMPQAANTAEALVDSAMYLGASGSGFTAIKLADKAEKLLNKSNKNIPS